jgi:hypothetical protein
MVSKFVVLILGGSFAVATVAQQRDEAYALAIASEDELFHFYLYDWHVSRDLQEQLLEVSISGSKS